MSNNTFDLGRDVVRLAAVERLRVEHNASRQLRLGTVDVNLERSSRLYNI